MSNDQNKQINGAEDEIVKASQTTNGDLPDFDDDDPLNAKDYVDADDFYYDHYDDFFDYEDAEDYWEDNN